MGEQFVWVRDAISRMSGPLHQDTVAAFPQRYETNINHPVRNTRGELLAWKPSTNARARAARGKASTDTEAIAETGATKKED